LLVFHITLSSAILFTSSELYFVISQRDTFSQQRCFECCRRQYDHRFLVRTPGNKCHAICQNVRNIFISWTLYLSYMNVRYI